MESAEERRHQQNCSPFSRSSHQSLKRISPEGDFLGGSISSFDERFPPERLEELWRAAGIHGVRTKRMSLGGGVIAWGRKRG